MSNETQFDLANKSHDCVLEAVAALDKAIEYAAEAFVEWDDNDRDGFTRLAKRIVGLKRAKDLITYGR